MARFLKIAAPVACVAAICGAAIVWPVYKAKAADRKLAAAARVRAQRGDAEAQSDLAFMYLHGNGVPLNYAEAARWYRTAADQSYAKAQTNLGSMYYYGEGVPQNYTEA